METILKKATKIVESYKLIDPDVANGSMVEEIAHLIVDHLFIHGEAIEDFDFDNLFKNIKLK